MLNDRLAVEIAAKAKQKNVAQPKRSTRDFDRIFSDFFPSHNFAGETILELGPGQYDFARRVRDGGGIIHAVDNDSAVIDLGRHLGFEVLECNLKNLNAEIRPGSYDGLFCKFSINAFWIPPDKLESHIHSLNSLLKPDGWGWIAPWNGAKKRDLNDPETIRHLRRQKEIFQDCGWEALDLDDSLASCYGICGDVANHPLFLKKIMFPQTAQLGKPWFGVFKHKLIQMLSR